MTMAEFRAPGRTIFGRGALIQAGEASRGLGHRALIVSGPNNARLGRVDQLRQILAEAGIASVPYSGIMAEPTVAMVAGGLTLLRETGCDLVIGIGGGSALDAAKAIALLAAHGGRIGDYAGIGKVPGPTLPVVAIPTTAGSGSEATRFAVVIDPDAGTKALMGSPYLIPTLAILDPELTISAPPRVTADAGIDALCHAIEAYISRRANPMTDLLALSAVRLIAGNLRRAWQDGPDLEARPGGPDLEAREAVLLGAYQAALAVSNSSVALGHGMARPMGGLFGLPHGLCNAILLPEVMAFTAPAAPARFADLARALGVDDPVPHPAVPAVSRLCADLQIPTLRGAGVDLGRFRSLAPRMASDALQSGSPANNPRLATAEEIAGLYRALAAR